MADVASRRVAMLVQKLAQADLRNGCCANHGEYQNRCCVCSMSPKFVRIEMGQTCDWIDIAGWIRLTKATLTSVGRSGNSHP